MRVRRRALASLLLALALTLPATGAALAASPSPDPAPASGSSTVASKVVTYAGTGTTTNPSNPAYAQYAATLPTSATVDCTGGPCTIVSIVTDTTTGDIVYDLTDGQKVPFSGGHVAVHIAGHPEAVCVDGLVPPGDFSATASGDTITVSYAWGGLPETTCADGSTASAPTGYIYSAVLTATAGTPCLATGTCPTPTPTPAAAPTVAPAAASGPLRITPHAVRVSDPSVLSALPTTATALTPANILWAVAATVVLVLLIAFPTHLLNTATEAGTDRVSEWWRARRRSPSEPEAPTGVGKGVGTATEADAGDATSARPVDYAGWPLAAAGVLAASLISSFVDPSFGFNAASIRVFLSILLSFILDAVLGWFLLILFVRRANPGATARFTFTPASLLIVVVAVLFTRVTGFTPGIVFGLVAGVAFGAIVATADKARQTMIGLGYSFVLAVIGWAGYSAIASTVGAHPAAPVVFVQETLSSMAIGGIAALPIALIPLRGMAGHAVWSWSRWVWGSAYAIGLLGFFVVLMPKPFSWATVGLSLGTWIAIYLAYALIAVALWLVAARPWRRGDDGAPTEPERSTISDRAVVQSPDAAAGP